MTICHVCWAEQHGYSEAQVRRPGAANARCTEHMRRMPVRFTCERCGIAITNTAGALSSVDEALDLMGELMAYLTSGSDEAEEDRRHLEGDEIEEIEIPVIGIWCHACWHVAHPNARAERDEQGRGVCSYHGYQEMQPEGLYRCRDCERGIILLHENSVAFIRQRFDLPPDTRISRDNPEHEKIHAFMYDYAKMQATTRRN